MKRSFSFTKVNGCGNDFVLIDRSRIDRILLDQLDKQFRAGFARKLCDRRQGIGADGILLLDSTGDHWTAQIVNADGSDGGMCGNGLRCITIYLQRQGVMGVEEVCTIEMGGRKTRVEIEQTDPFRSALDLGSVCVGVISPDHALDHGRIATLTTRIGADRFGVAWAGNPHAIVIRPDCSPTDLRSATRILRSSGCFPDGVNVTLASATGRRSLVAHTDERGVGPTAACASGAAALVAVALEAGLVDADCEVKMPGGLLSVALSPDEQKSRCFNARIAGTAEITFTGEVHFSASNSLP